MVLVNGAEGIGTGWSTNIPLFSPREVARNIMRKLDGDSFIPMMPFFKGYKGNIV